MKTAKDIDSYIKDAPKEAQQMLKQMRATIRKAAPKATEKIAWGMPTFVLEGNLVHIAAFKKHVTFFTGTGTLASLLGKLKKYKTSKSGIQFQYGEKVNTAVVTKLTKLRVKQNLEKKKQKKSKPRIFS